MYAGLTGWCLSQSRHQRRVFNIALSRSVTWVLRAAGSGCLLLAFYVLTWEHAGLSLAAASSGLLTFCALLLIFLLPYQPRVAVGLSLAGILFVAVFAI
ncbi:MAG: DUF3325 domain-containing protein [Verrucomicrobiae bacterium]|nr:DUF3325 domain-containing protein [Verrucomicrobiae bacterium]